MVLCSMISQAKETFQFDAIDDVLSDIAKGRMVIVTDDADRENEGDLDLARMAGLQAAGVLCEILHDDGTMARLPELMEFRSKHGLRICTIQSLIAYRRKSEKLVELEHIVKMPTDYGDFDLHLYRSKLDGQHHLALVKGKIDKSKPTLVRVHSQCLTGDVFASRRCDCGNQLHAALRQLQEEGNGGLVYF